MNSTTKNGDRKARTRERILALRAGRKRETIGRIARDYALILFGSALLAVSMHLFLFRMNS